MHSLNECVWMHEILQKATLYNVDQHLGRIIENSPSEVFKMTKH